MNLTSVFLITISGLLVCVETVPIGGGNGEEILDELEDVVVEAASSGNDTLSSSSSSSSLGESVGPPDSHEAMNNREINPKIREKRSYEFLMGLINNNSKYEVTRVDPTLTKKVTSENIAASELLLELMVRIAAHPDQWNKVHQLLQKIDSDLKTSKSIVENLKTDTKSTKTDINLIKKESLNDLTKEVAQYSSPESAGVFGDTSPKTVNEWPKFDDETNRIKFVNNNDKTASKYQNKSGTKSTYPKNFSYHRVTGKPFYLNKNPKAYIAVSVIAPKPVNTIRSATTASISDDDLTLENELQQLKPWTHEQNLKNMENIRSRWVIQTDTDSNVKNRSVAPNSL